MNEIHYGISQETLVSNIEHQSVPAKRLPQYIASLAATLGALANGMILAWTSSAGEDGKDLQSLYNITISKDEFSWISSLAVVGSAIMCIPIGILADIIGRKGSMLLMVIPFTIGWLLLIFANNLAMFYFGRFITGLSGAVFCVVAPIYTAEIAENEIRGSVGNYFPLLLTVGILLSYLLGTFVNMRILSIVSATIPVVFFVVFMFMPESPIYYLKKGLEDSAKKSLIRLRGVEYDIETELQHQKDALKENKNTVSFWTLIHQRATLKGFIVAYGLMFFQQLCGVNVVIFYTNYIFIKAGSTLDSHYLTIIIGAMQILAVFVSTLTVDRVGRRILLLASIICSGLATFVLGIYFYLLDNDIDVNSITWLPPTSLCIFIIMFNIGFGPLPWMMLGELFAAEVKGVAASSACFLNAVLGFTVTKFFSNLTNAIGIGPTFWLFTVVCVIGMFFVYLLVPETKGKSLGDIQKELNGY
ncbi:facilitated trehalose transporter Tret1-2 homolog [Frieseomelitta varia]|uniref:facilitated trehalose transporter Tret1-2 homolog n=1 Tax=Frieseomelitta varia TaxID=561572 RepID=UPI001CB6A25C|nr:facilitated trehalose transporter Tret1-2 homolog [Frieseomelitta varia]XP_043511979.1 facilitated trehalose transporter Tret1-2 homolog [Frieseomelitta varia]